MRTPAQDERSRFCLLPSSLRFAAGLLDPGPSATRRQPAPDPIRLLMLLVAGFCLAVTVVGALTQ